MGASEVFRALSDPTRREIVRMLRGHSMSAGEIADRFPLAKSTLSGHFGVLRSTGLIVSEKHAQSIVYSLNVSLFDDILSMVLDLLDVGKNAKTQNRRKDRS